MLVPYGENLLAAVQFPTLRTAPCWLSPTPHLIYSQLEADPVSSNEAFMPDCKRTYDRVKWGFVISGVQIACFATKVIKYPVPKHLVKKEHNGRSDIKLKELNLGTTCSVSQRNKFSVLTESGSGWTIDLVWSRRRIKKFCPAQNVTPAVQVVTGQFAGIVISDHSFVLFVLSAYLMLGYRGLL